MTWQLHWPYTHVQEISRKVIVLLLIFLKIYLCIRTENIESQRGRKLINLHIFIMCIIIILPFLAFSLIFISVILRVTYWNSKVAEFGYFNHHKNVLFPFNFVGITKIRHMCVFCLFSGDHSHTIHDTTLWFW